MMRQATNTVNNLRGIENSVYSSGKIVLAIHAVGKKGKCYMGLTQASRGSRSFAWGSRSCGHSPLECLSF